jgi:DNA-directed RNA polymerase specialized sigma24 family protein
MPSPRAVRASFDEDAIELLARRTLAGEPRAWRELWLAVDPAIEEMVGRWRLTGRLSEREDERRDIVVGVMERLAANDFERLRPFHEALVRRDGSGRAWLCVVARHAALNHTRRHAENLAPGERERRWAEIVPLPDDLDEPLPEPVQAVSAIDAHRIRACAERELPAEAVEALGLWLLGYEHDETAVRLGLDGGPRRRTASARGPQGPAPPVRRRRRTPRPSTRKLNNDPPPPQKRDRTQRREDAETRRDPGLFSWRLCVLAPLRRIPGSWRAVENKSTGARPGSPKNGVL